MSPPAAYTRSVASPAVATVMSTHVPAPREALVRSRHTPAAYAPAATAPVSSLGSSHGSPALPHTYEQLMLRSKQMQVAALRQELASLITQRHSVERELMSADTLLSWLYTVSGGAETSPSIVLRGIPAAPARAAAATNVTTSPDANAGPRTRVRGSRGGRRLSRGAAASTRGDH